MGLAGRKQKQRIPADPRNLSWADDASRFGLLYLSKFGWDSSKGLGASGDGVKTHLSVHQKLDMMGIGAQHQRDPNGIAWKQNKEFEALLKRLNQSASHGEGTDDGDVREDNITARKEMNEAFVRSQEEVDKKPEGSSLTTAKRKYKDGDESASGESTRKKQKKDKKDKKKHYGSSPTDDIHPPSDMSKTPPTSEPHSEAVPKARPMAHRARIRAAKCIAGKSASAIAEILGIAPSPSISTLSSASATPASLSTPTPQPASSLDNLTISTKSVADYFKEKLSSRSSSSSALPSGTTTPGLGATGPRLGLSAPDEDEPEIPRRGIGSCIPAGLLSQLPEVPSMSPASKDTAGEQDKRTEKRRRKEERKAERRKRREAEANQAITGDASTVVEDGHEEHAVKIRGIPTKERKRKKPRVDANSTATTVRKRV